MIDLDQYGEFTDTTAVYPFHDTGTTHALWYAVCALNEEAGEVAGVLKKHWRNAPEYELPSWHDPDFLHKMQLELGDVIYYWIRIHRELGLDPIHTLQSNITKLTGRKDRDELKVHE